jgi:hypothetical protein
VVIAHDVNLITKNFSRGAGHYIPISGKGENWKPVEETVRRTKNIKGIEKTSKKTI